MKKFAALKPRKETTNSLRNQLETARCVSISRNTKKKQTRDSLLIFTYLILLVVSRNYISIFSLLSFKDKQFEEKKKVERLINLKRKINFLFSYSKVKETFFS